MIRFRWRAGHACVVSGFRRESTAGDAMMNGCRTLCKVQGRHSLMISAHVDGTAVVAEASWEQAFSVSRAMEGNGKKVVWSCRTDSAFDKTLRTER